MAETTVTQPNSAPTSVADPPATATRGTSSTSPTSARVAPSPAPRPKPTASTTVSISDETRGAAAAPHPGLDQIKQINTGDTLRFGAGMGKRTEQADDVRGMQGFLKSQGYDLGVHGVDGKYGVDTRAAVRKYQQDHHGLQVDGVAGAQTLGAMSHQSSDPEAQPAASTAPARPGPVSPTTDSPPAQKSAVDPPFAPQQAQATPTPSEPQSGEPPTSTSSAATTPPSPTSQQAAPQDTAPPTDTRSLHDLNVQALQQLSPAQRQYVLDNYGSLLNSGVQLNVSRPNGNGGMPVLTFQQGDLQQRLAADPNLKYSVQTHYHGDIRPGRPNYQDSSTVVGAMGRVWQKDPNAVFVMPQTTTFGAATGNRPIGAQWGNTRQGISDWTNVSNEATTTRDALISAGLDPRRAGDLTVSGHSSGGYPVERMMAATAAHPNNPTIAANRILLLDTVSGSLRNDGVDRWWQQNRPGAITYVDAEMNTLESQARRYGWNVLHANNHWDAVQRFFGYRG